MVAIEEAENVVYELISLSWQKITFKKAQIDNNNYNAMWSQNATSFPHLWSIAPQAIR